MTRNSCAARLPVDVCGHTTDSASSNRTAGGAFYKKHLKFSRRALELVMLRADTMSCQPDKYRRRVREIFRFAADQAQRLLDEEMASDRRNQRSQSGNGA